MDDVIYILLGVLAFFSVAILYLLKKEEKDAKKH